MKKCLATRRRKRRQIKGIRDKNREKVNNVMRRRHKGIFETKRNRRRKTRRVVRKVGRRRRSRRRDRRTGKVTRKLGR
jgi:hypothetical protein